MARDVHGYSWTTPVKWSLSLLWTGFWMLGGIGAGVDPTDGTSLAAGIALAIGFGVLPMIPFWWRWSRGWRELRRNEHRARTQTEAENRVRRLPERLRGPWQRLVEAEALVMSLADQGWIEALSLSELQGEIERLEALAIADHKTDMLGGDVTESVDRRIGQLIDLLVALADEAVEHQAVIASDGHIPATLAEAKDRMRHTRVAYQDLMRLTSRAEPETDDDGETEREQTS